MQVVEIIDKATGAVTQVPTENVALRAPSVVRLDLTREQIATLERQGNDLVAVTNNGERIQIDNFYSEGPQPSDLVLRETNGTQWLARPENGLARYSLITDIEEVTGAATAAAAGGAGGGLLIPAVLGGLAVAGGAAALAGGGGGGNGGTAPSPPPDTTPPTAPTASFRADGAAVLGRGEPGATVQVRNAAGVVVGTAVVGTDGSFTVPLGTALTNGQSVTVIQTDPAGNASPPTGVNAPDTTAPTAPTATMNANGTAVTGTGEAGATVQLRDGAGTVIATATVAADGSFNLPLTPPRTNGETLSVVQVDAGGNTSPGTSVTAPDTTAPAAPTATVAGDGLAVTGTGEPGATVRVTGAGGVVLGTGVVAADGSFIVAVTPAQANGETLSVVQVDAAGNTSSPTSVTAPDTTAPAAPTATVAGDGLAVTGTGEPGATVRVTGAGGVVLGTGVVAADGSFAVSIAPAQIDGESLSVVQTDASGNASTPASVTAPDTTAPAAPTATVAGDGLAVTGTGEPGATVRVTGPGGVVLGTGTVATDGSFTFAITPAQANGETLSVVQADPAGNDSPAISIVAQDTTAPGAPLANVAADGAAVIGTGEAGATVNVTDADGTVLGTVTVTSDGSFTVPLSPALSDGEALSVVQTDVAGNTSAATSVIAPDTTIPDVPVASVAADGAAVTGTGEAGATISVTGQDGTVLGTAIVAADGSFTVALTPAQADGETVSVVQTDRAGNASAPLTLVAPDITGPDAPLAVISDDGALVSGSGEAGATVSVMHPDGWEMGTTTVDEDGNFEVLLAPPLTDGETVHVFLIDLASNPSEPTMLTAPDITPPDVPVAAVNADGTAVVGTGEPGATVSVTDASGTVLGTAIVADDGSFTVAVTPSQANGETLSVAQTDPAGNPSPAISVTAPDITGPAAPVVAVNADGTAVTGTGEVGAAITVTGPGGAVLGNGTVGPDGSFTIPLTTPQTNGETVSVVLTDPTGNPSAPGTATAPDFTVPDVPVAAVNADGSAVTGTGEPGATITVTSAAGATLGSATVAADGSFTVPLNPAQIDRQQLNLVQSDAAGNDSPTLGLIAPDLTPPAVPVATIDGSGQTVTGTGEPGATVNVRDTAGTILGTATVNAQGAFAVTLNPPQIDSQPLSVTQVDTAGNVSPAAPLVAPDLTAPVAPTAIVAGDGTTLSGTGEAGATVTIRDPFDVVIGTALVAADGSYTATLTPAQVDGELLNVVQADPAGNVSPAATVLAPDLVPDTAPDAPTASVAADGASITGVALANATITVYDANGTIVADGVADANGAYSIALTPPQLDGELFKVTQTDALNQVSPPATAIAPDLTAPPAPTATVDQTGTIVTGTGQPGATVSVRDPSGTVIGTAQVAANGSYSAILSTAQVDGQVLSIVQADRAGNVSPPATVTAPDDTAPAEPTGSVAPDGLAVTGTGEAGATVTVRDASGAIVGTALVAADGSYSAPLNPAQANGETLSVIQTDPAGNDSTPLDLTAPDITPPAAPAATIDGDGATVTGTGEVGATVTVRGPDGTVLGTAVVIADGSYSVTLNPAQDDGQELSVVQADVAGNISAETDLTAPDLVPPDAPFTTFSNDGGEASGTGEPGATLIIRTTLGVEVGRTTVLADGSFTATLTPPQANGQTLLVTQSDAAGNVSPTVSVIAPDVTAPLAPIATISADGATLTGTGEAGARLNVRTLSGTLIVSVVVGADGSFTIPLVPPRVDGETLALRQVDAAGNISAAATVVAPVIAPPGELTAAVDTLGQVVTGTGTIGATVTVRDPLGTAIGTAVVQADGTYSATLTPPQVDGEVLTVVQVDGGVTSPPVQTIAPDLTAPPLPVASIDPQGLTVSGTGEVGATVTVRGPGGLILGTAEVQADGSYSVTLVPPQIDTQALTVIQTDAAGNASPAASLTAPDLTPPALPVANLDSQGAVVSGTGEVGATITVRGPGGVFLGSTQVLADGSYSVTLVPPQIDRQLLSVVQADAAGNVSAAVSLTAPDLTPPALPVANIDAQGAVVSGTGEVGATVTVRGPGGVFLGSAQVLADGSYSVTLLSPQINLQALTVVQVDAAGNASPAAPLTAPDLTPPAAPTIVIGADGLTVTGTGEVGATVTFTGPGGVPLGTATVVAGGTYSTTLTAAQLNGQLVTAVQTDAAGNVSLPGTVIAPDTTVPLTPTATISGDGVQVTGTGEPNARLLVRNAVGLTIGFATVAADGSFTVTLNPPQRNGEALTAVQVDAAGNVSPSIGLAAPDLTPPAVPTAVISPDGAIVSGIGEAGATVIVTRGGVELGRVVAGAGGAYSITLSAPQIDREVLTVVQRDPANNPSPAVTVVAPDRTPPAEPDSVLDETTGILTGVGEAGATVTVRGPGGLFLGSTVAGSDGTYTIALLEPMRNGETLTVVQVDAAGNSSPAETVIALDITPPAAPTASIALDGATVSGTGEVGALVTVTALDGTQLGTVRITNPDGSFDVALTTPQRNGERILVVQTDAAANASPAISLVARDTTPPPVPVANVSADGWFVLGTGEHGAIVRIYSASDVLLGEGVVDANGDFAVRLLTRQVEGQQLSVTLTDAAGNVSNEATVIAPNDPTALPLSAIVGADGLTISGQGVAGREIIVRNAANVAVATVIVGLDGNYSTAFTLPQRNGERLTVTQTEIGGGGTTQTVLAIAPDLTAPIAPTAIVAPDGLVLSGTGEAGARVTVTGASGVLGSATVAANGTYSIALNPPQANGEALSVRQVDAAGNQSAATSVTAPDITPPAPPASLAVAADGNNITGTGEVGARVEVRNAAGTVIGTGTVRADGGFTVALSAAQIRGQALSVTQTDAAGNRSGAASVIAPFDIDAFDNIDTAAIDLLPVTTNVNKGTAAYVALVSLGLLDLNAQVLATPNVQFTVAQGHTFNATFTYDSLAAIGVLGGYSVGIQRFNGTAWVPVDTGNAATFLQLSLLGGDITATRLLGPGQYRAFLTFDGAVGVGLLGSLNVAGVDSDYTEIASVRPEAATGNIITDPGPGGQVDLVSPQTRVASVTINGVTTQVTADGTVVNGSWGRLTINLDGSYVYTPGANPAAIGQTDRFQYTLLDASDGELASATLTINIGSAAITGTPVATSDVAVASVSYQNIVTAVPPALGVSFNTAGALLLNPQTGTGHGSFTVTAGTRADVTVTAVQTSALSVLPSYTITVFNAAGTQVATTTAAVLLGALGPSVPLSLSGLAAGTYSYTVSSTNALGTGYATGVYVGQSVTHLNDYRVSGTVAAEGNLLANDTANSAFFALRVGRGAGSLTTVGDNPLDIVGAHGTLTVTETGGYVYRVNPSLPYSATDLIDSFTYQIVLPNGQTASATLNVTVDVPANGRLTPTVAIQTMAADPDDAALSALASPDGMDDVHAYQAALTFDMFEGQGEVADALSNFLDAHPGEDANSSVSVNDISTNISALNDHPQDPFSYLAEEDKHAREHATQHIM